MRSYKNHNKLNFQDGGFNLYQYKGKTQWITFEFGGHFKWLRWSRLIPAAFSLKVIAEVRAQGLLAQGNGCLDPHPVSTKG